MCMTMFTFTRYESIDFEKVYDYVDPHAVDLDQAYYCVDLFQAYISIDIYPVGFVHVLILTCYISQLTPAVLILTRSISLLILT